MRIASHQELPAQMVAILLFIKPPTASKHYKGIDHWLPETVD
jgi:hypothetical protein